MQTMHLMNLTTMPPDPREFDPLQQIERAQRFDRAMAVERAQRAAIEADRQLRNATEAERAMRAATETQAFRHSLFGF